MSADAKDPVSTMARDIDAAIANGDSAKLAFLAEQARALYERIDHKLARASIAFCKANAHSNIRQLAIASDSDLSWEWDSPQLKQEIYWLRKAQSELETAETGLHQAELRTRVETNLGNAISHVGRFVESIDHWDKALAARPGFGMALACRGDGLSYYARALYDHGHRTIFVWKAREALAAGLKAGLEAHARPAVKRTLAEIEGLTDWSGFTPKLDGYTLGRSKAEREYRAWCLDQRLFLNPLNDLGPYSIGACDVLTFPSILLPKTHLPRLVPEVYGIYNQLVQEFVSARFTVYEALNTLRDPGHYSDRDVLLYDTLDYRILRLWIERLKMAYLSAFAIFDKIAFLINHYWKLGVEERRITFGTVWFIEGDVRRGLRPEFNGAQNWPLRGLFALSRDLFWKSDEDFAAEPEARRLQHLRNYIAHKYFSVHYTFGQSANLLADDLYADALSYKVAEDDLPHAALKVLKLARSALIYTSLAAHRREENNRSEKQGLYASMPLFPLGDRRL
jgi:hypothetical protein